MDPITQSLCTFEFDFIVAILTSDEITISMIEDGVTTTETLTITVVSTETPRPSIISLFRKKRDNGGDPDCDGGAAPRTRRSWPEATPYGQGADFGSELLYGNGDGGGPFGHDGQSAYGGGRESDHGSYGGSSGQGRGGYKGSSGNYNGNGNGDHDSGGQGGGHEEYSGDVGHGGNGGYHGGSSNGGYNGGSNEDYGGGNGKAII
ncbi:hypothetical protein LQW54_002694 [Pestalotiopsis sp. IQ-011]